jgi:hypothetical protein
MIHQKDKELKTDNKQRLQALLVGLITLVGVYTLLEIGGEKRTSLKSKRIHRHKSESKRIRGIRNFKSPRRKLSKINSRKIKETFSAFTTKTLNELPTLNTVRSLSHQDLIHGQSFIITAGKSIGRVIDLMQEDPAKRAQTREFLNLCMKAKNIYKPVRALCLNYLVSYQSEFDKQLDIAKVDARVKEIYNFIHTI